MTKLQQLIAINLWVVPEDPRAFEKSLRRVAQHAWRSRNRAQARATDRASYSRNRVARISGMKKYALEHPDVVQAAKKKYYTRNLQLCKNRATISNRRPERRAWLRTWTKNRRNQDPVWKLQQNARTRIWWALRGSGATKTASGLELLGVSSREDFFYKLNAKFSGKYPPGEYGKDWEWDHVKPCASFELTDPSQQRACFHWTNLQPLSCFDNRSKGAR